MFQCVVLYLRKRIRLCSSKQNALPKTKTKKMKQALRLLHHNRYSMPGSRQEPSHVPNALKSLWLNIVRTIYCLAYQLQLLGVTFCRIKSVDLQLDMPARAFACTSRSIKYENAD